MKKILSIILIIALVLSFVACGKKANDETVKDDGSIVETDKIENEKVELLDKEESSNDKKDETAENKPVSKPAENKPQVKPEAKPEEKPQSKPEAAPEKVPETKPEVTPEKEPEKDPESATVIKFSGGAMPVEEGLLSGFGNTEIKGFKSGAMFAPMIGSIPFVGYVFELSDGTNASSFISTLKSNADLRWNICVAADEMVTGSVGNKVFFVMCPTSLED